MYIRVKACFVTIRGIAGYLTLQPRYPFRSKAGSPTGDELGGR